jgi:hypothetical protein
VNSGVWALGSFAARDHLLRVQEVIWNGFPAFFTGYLCFVNSPREVGILTVAQKPRQVSCVPILTSLLIYPADRIERRTLHCGLGVVVLFHHGFSFSVSCWMRRAASIIVSTISGSDNLLLNREMHLIGEIGILESRCLYI